MSALTVRCGVLVLAIADDVSVLRPTLPRSTLPCFLPAAILAAAGGVVGGPVVGAIRLVVAVCDDRVARSIAVAVGSISGVGAQQHSGVYLVAAEPGHALEFFGIARLYGAVFAVGVDGV